MENKFDSDSLEKKPFGDTFPLYNTITCTALGFTDIQANALSQFASWVIAGDENKDEFKSLFQ